MNTRELKSAWEQQKEYFDNQKISEDDILFAIHQDFGKRAKIRRLLYNSSIFLFLFTFCQTC